MSQASRDFEGLGVFYLGRTVMPDSGETTSEPLLYDARDLTTHALIVGMTGSGKTGLGIGLIEEAVLDGIPVIAIDPKGDLGNLLLAFPELRPEDFEPWIDPAEAARNGRTLQQEARATAEAWRGGLAAWGQTPERVARFAAAAEAVLYTPGSSAGRPLRLLRTLAAPPPAVRGRRGAPGADPRQRLGAARPARHRRGPAPQPRADPAHPDPRAQLERRT